MRVSAVLFLAAVLLFLNSEVRAAEPLRNDVRALAIGCGDKTVGEGNEVEEIVSCYRKGINHHFREKLTTLGIAFDVCSSFSIESQQLACLLRYKEEAHDSALYSLFGECTISEKDVRKKVEKTMACLKTKQVKDPKKYSAKTGEEVELTEKTSQYITFVNKTCGSKESLSTFHEEAVENLANCYQAALMNLDPAKIKNSELAIALCENFENQISRLECFRRSATELKDPKYAQSIEECTTPKSKVKQLSREEAYKRIKYRVGAGYELSQKKYAIVTTCIRDAYRGIGNEAVEGVSGGASAPAGQGRR